MKVVTIMNRSGWWQRVWENLSTKLRLRRRSTILQAPTEINFLSLNRLDAKFKTLRLLKDARRHA